jgi:hypothetical protein
MPVLADELVATVVVELLDDDEADDDLVDVVAVVLEVVSEPPVPPVVPPSSPQAAAAATKGQRKRARRLAKAIELMKKTPIEPGFGERNGRRALAAALVRDLRAARSAAPIRC